MREFIVFSNSFTVSTSNFRLKVFRFKKYYICACKLIFE